MGKKAIAVIIDLLLLAATTVSAYMIISGGCSDFLVKIFSLVIFVSIPTIFLMTMLSFAGDKFDNEATELFDENDDDNAEEKNSSDDKGSSDEK